jgi:hypothetical protein
VVYYKHREGKGRKKSPDLKNRVKAKTFTKII